MSHLLCNEALRRQIEDNLARFQRVAHDPSGLRHSAVALVVVDSPEPAGIFGIHHLDHLPQRAALILTRRTPKLQRHSGQWALPGGRMDPGESAEEAALRELDEEVGLSLDAGNILGKLDDYTTRSGFVITPVVVWGGGDRTLAADPGEVQSIHRIPVDEFMRRDAPELEVHNKGEEPVLRMPVGARGIFAPTGALLYQFREVAILGKDTRVAHYEQPEFARR